MKKMKTETLNENNRLFFRIVDKKRVHNGNLEGVSIRGKGGKKSYRGIELNRWNNWDSSFWVRFFCGESSVIVDSGVIEELAGVIRREKKRGAIKK